ncbi:MAG: hypothetical protein LBT47_04655 [Deltaproteobacteria bacterium]|jgi:hypothetical protein|nr:hypothetical protein [Deltaproteobacteria bacterium]
MRTLRSTIFSGFPHVFGLFFPVVSHHQSGVDSTNLFKPVPYFRTIKTASQLLFHLAELKQMLRLTIGGADVVAFGMGQLACYPTTMFFRNAGHGGIKQISATDICHW